MMTEIKDVRIYIFNNNDGKSAEERLRESVTDYSKAYVGILGGNVTDLKEKLQIARTDRGKPYFPRLPEIHFSISHSGAYWGCAVATEPIGMDLQEHTRLKDETVEEASIRFLKLAKRFLHPKEAEFVKHDAYNHFFTVWTAKESYVKYTGRGIDDEFSERCVIPEKTELWTQFLVKNDVVIWNSQTEWFSSEKYQENYTLCICTQNKHRALVLKCY